MLKAVNVALAAIFALCGSSLAATSTFTGAGDGYSWSDAANWDNGVPVVTSTGDSADSAVVNGYDVLVDASVQYIASLTIDGDGSVTLADGVTLGVNSMDIVSGGLILGSAGGTASIGWGKANRGHLYVEADGYIRGSGNINNMSGTAGVAIRSNRAADFDMTDIALRIGYTGHLTVNSVDLGRESLDAWQASNFTIGEVIFADRRYGHTLRRASDDSMFYCYELTFGGYTGATSNLDINGAYVYARDAVNFVSGNAVTTAGELTVYPLCDVNDPVTAIWDDSDDPGRAYVGVGLSPNDPPVAIAGDDQSRMDDDNNGFEDFDLDASASYDEDGYIADYSWSEGGTEIATGAFPTVTLGVGTHVITLTVTDDDGATATDELTIEVEDPGAMYPPTAVAGDDQVVQDADDSGSEMVTLDGSASSDEGTGTIVSYSWQVDGSEIATGVSPTVDFAVGTHEVTLVVTDNHSQTDSDVVYITVTQAWIGDPLVPMELENRKSGISVFLDGTNGSDYAVERLYHDPSLGDQLVYITSDVLIELAHNENNSIMNRDVGLPGIIGTGGLDGIDDNGDEGDIHWKIDRDMQSHGYTTVGLSIPSYAPLYSGPIDLTALTYDDGIPVLGTVGDNGGPWGSSPASTGSRYAYGQYDRFGNEWHTLTYWDNDDAVYSAAGVSPHRQAASDGHRLYICVDPVTPVVQFSAVAGEQYYTTPLKTYHVPKTWDQTTYLTAGVDISLLNITNDLPIFYRVDDGAWQQYRTAYMAAGDIIPGNEGLLQARIGADGPIFSRYIVVNPTTPAPEETHGYMLWASDTEKQQCIDKLNNVQPFARSYDRLVDDLSTTASYSDARSGWRSGAGMASSSMARAFAVAIDGPQVHPELADIAKTQLLRMARLEPIGFENGVSFATPAKDYLNELSQTLQLFADAGVAYDLLASCYRDSDDPAGMTAIEEMFIRDGLAEIAKSIIQFRDNWSYISGSGDTHWAHGYELAVGIIAASMPSYATEYFGVSGADMTTVNNLDDEYGEFWNPFPFQNATWWQCATDSEIATPGYPDNKAPQRCEFLLTDDGWWTGPNDLHGDGSRYFTGPSGRQLVDIKYGGMANAECRVELAEMDGYEAPFPTRLQVLEFIRRQRGDTNRQQCVDSYIRRQQMFGYRTYGWDSETEIYTPRDARVTASLCAFNDHFEGAALTSSVNLMSDYLSDVNRYYGYESGDASDYISDGGYKSLLYVYPLALCWSPDDLAAPVIDNNHAPIIRPMFKYVVAPGTAISKPIYAVDLDDDTVNITVTDLPTGAVYNAGEKTITWTPTNADLGVHIVRVYASDGTAITVRPFPIIVMAAPGSGPIASAPQNVTASLSGDDATLSWEAPADGDVAAYVIYKDGALIDVVDSTTTTWTELNLPGGSHTRYHVAVLDSAGHESSAATPTPAIISVLRSNVPVLPGDANGDGTVDLDDFIILKQNYGRSDVGWNKGDFNGDGIVDLDDFIILKQNYGESVANVGVVVTIPTDNDDDDDDDNGTTPNPNPGSDDDDDDNDGSRDAITGRDSDTIGSDREGISSDRSDIGSDRDSISSDRSGITGR